MVITEDNFKMIHDGWNSFDLYFKYINKKGEEDWKLRGYSMQLITCIKAILFEELENKYNELDLKTFIEEYKNMHTKLINMFKTYGL